MADQLITEIYLLASLLYVAAQSGLAGQTYQTITDKVCRTDADCAYQLGEQCLNAYEGCPRGRCMCDPRTQRLQDGLCKYVKMGGSPCNVSDLCPHDMTCSDGLCKCSAAKTVTSDGTFCLGHREKVLGDSCQNGEICYHRTDQGYEDHDVYCNTRTSRCECGLGFKRSGGSCTKWLAKEHGCLKSYHCQGGALCRGGYCECPNGYYPISQGTKCAKISAIINLPLGQRCDEFNENRYCQAGFMCHSCTEYSPKRCLRYLLTDVGSYASSSPTVHVFLSTGLSVLCCIATLLVFKPSS